MFGKSIKPTKVTARVVENPNIERYKSIILKKDYALSDIVKRVCTNNPDVKTNQYLLLKDVLEAIIHTRPEYLEHKLTPVEYVTLISDPSASDFPKVSSIIRVIPKD